MESSVKLAFFGILLVIILASNWYLGYYWKSGDGFYYWTNKQEKKIRNGIFCICILFALILIFTFAFKNFMLEKQFIIITIVFTIAGVGLAIFSEILLGFYGYIMQVKMVKAMMKELMKNKPNDLLENYILQIASNKSHYSRDIVEKTCKRVYKKYNKRK